LRIARFAARFADLGFTVAPETQQLMQQIVKAGELHALTAERVWKEVERALGEKSPLAFFVELANCQALSQLWPFLDISGVAATALTQASATSTATVVRFAALLHAITVADLNFFSKRYRVPKIYRALAYIVIKYHLTMLNFAKLSPTAIVELFINLDAFRRYERFLQFLECCQILAKIYHKTTFSVDDVMQAYVIAKPVNISSLIKPSSNDAMAAQIKAQRVSALAKWLKQRPL
jgi:tRNA nucleotidyltransferase (CCA-adding enzyme)